jgi:anti-anti-sigma factor
MNTSSTVSSLIINPLASGLGRLFAYPPATDPKPPNLGDQRVRLGYEPGVREIEVAVLELEGDYDLARADSLRDSVSPLINEGRGMILDLTGVTLIDSLSVGVLINAHQRCEFRGIPFALVVAASPDDPVRHSLRLTGVLMSMPVFTTVEEARRLMPPPRPSEI